MNRQDLFRQWMAEEKAAHIRGWDFSHISGRYEAEHDLPWNYASIVKRYLSPKHKLLDLDTGGAEFLLSLNHPFKNTSATEAYPPNVALCQDKLLPLGIEFKEANAYGSLPFADQSFNIVINRHGNFNAKEIWRVLKAGGMWITEQVGAENDRELVSLLFSRPPALPFPGQYLLPTKSAFESVGFQILDAQEAFRPIKFWDVGALVWFAHIIEWEFPHFGVERCLDRLWLAQKALEQTGCIEGRIHRFLLVAKKPM